MRRIFIPALAASALALFATHRLVRGARDASLHVDEAYSALALERRRASGTSSLMPRQRRSTTASLPNVEKSRKVERKKREKKRKETETK